MAVDQSSVPQNKPKTNNFALACAILASMTSILLGYGEFHYCYAYILFQLNLFQK